MAELHHVVWRGLAPVKAHLEAVGDEEEERRVLCAKDEAGRTVLDLVALQGDPWVWAWLHDRGRAASLSCAALHGPFAMHTAAAARALPLLALLRRDGLHAEMLHARDASGGSVLHAAAAGAALQVVAYLHSAGLLSVSDLEDDVSSSGYTPLQVVPQTCPTTRRLLAQWAQRGAPHVVSWHPRDVALPPVVAALVVLSLAKLPFLPYGVFALLLIVLFIVLSPFIHVHLFTLARPFRRAPAVTVAYATCLCLPYVLMFATGLATAPDVILVLGLLLAMVVTYWRTAFVNYPRALGGASDAAVTGIAAHVAEHGVLPDHAHAFCRSCLVVRPPRCKHDKISGRCVVDFDHFCIFMDAPIGRSNRADFVLFLLATTAAAVVFVYFFWFALPVVSDATAVDSDWLPFQPHFRQAPFAAIGLLFTFLFFLGVSTLLIGQLVLISLRLTTNEFVSSHRQPYSTYLSLPLVRGHYRVRSAYSEGFVRNWMHVLRGGNGAEGEGDSR